LFNITSELFWRLSFERQNHRIRDRYFHIKLICFKKYESQVFQETKLPEEYLDVKERNGRFKIL
jgi:hypothetical protein